MNWILDDVMDYCNFLKWKWYFTYIVGFTSAQGAPGKEPTCQCRRCKRRGFDPWVRKIPWSRKRQATSVFLPGLSHGQRRLVGCSPWGRKESDTTEHAPMHSLLCRGNLYRLSSKYRKAQIVRQDNKYNLSIHQRNCCTRLRL